MKQRHFAAFPYPPETTISFFLKHFYLEPLLFLYLCPLEHRVSISTCVGLEIKAVSLPPQVGGKKCQLFFCFLLSCDHTSAFERLNPTASHSLYVSRWL